MALPVPSWWPASHRLSFMRRMGKHYQRSPLELLSVGNAPRSVPGARSTNNDRRDDWISVEVYNLHSLFDIYRAIVVIRFLS